MRIMFTTLINFQMFNSPNWFSTGFRSSIYKLKMKFNFDEKKTLILRTLLLFQCILLAAVLLDAEWISQYDWKFQFHYSLWLALRYFDKTCARLRTVALLSYVLRLHKAATSLNDMHSRWVNSANRMCVANT